MIRDLGVGTELPCSECGVVRPWAAIEHDSGRMLCADCRDIGPPCGSCKGAGSLGGRICSRCGGKGRIVETFRPAVIIADGPAIPFTLTPPAGSMEARRWEIAAEHGMTPDDPRVRLAVAEERMGTTASRRETSP